MLSLTPLLQIRALTRSYRKGVAGHDTTHTILRNLNLDVYANERVAIVGPQGSGKTTLLYCLAGMLPPSSGTIFWNLPNTGPAPVLAYIPEKGTFYNFLTVAETLEYYITDSALTTADRTLRIQKTLTLTNLSEFAHTPISSLTADVVPRLRLAQALAGQPQVLLIDELVTGLPPATWKAFLPLLHTLSVSGLTIIMTTHELATATALATRIVHINKAPGQPGAVLTPQPPVSRIAPPPS